MPFEKQHSVSAQPAPNAKPAMVSALTSLLLLTPNQVDYVDPANRYFPLFSSLFFILYPVKASYLLPRVAVLQMELVSFTKR